MAIKSVLALVALIAVPTTAKEQTRWSRQISSYTSDITDWVPLSGPVDKELPPIKRQAVAEPRILSEPFPGFIRPTGFSQDGFPSRAFYNSPPNRQLYLQSVPSAPQNYLSDQGFGQGLRIGLSQPNFPLSQGFITPQFHFDSVPQLKPRPNTSGNPIKFESTIKTNHPITSTFKSFNSQGPKPEAPKFIDGHRAENSSNYNFEKKKPQSLQQKIKFEDNNKSKESILSNPKVEKEEVQLLYVPLESLNRERFNFRSPITSAQILNTEHYNQNQRLNPIVQNLAGEFQKPAVKPQDSFNSREYLTSFNSQLYEMDPFNRFSTLTLPFPTTAATTLRPKKLKPHQPPLAIFLTQETKKENEIKVVDVLNSLKSADTVAVLDSVNPLSAPKVFIGPSSLTSPENYVKFDLPYLSNIENADKKLRQLPFFVAPLRYSTPQGFAKIPFPSPHVGSVVINSLIKDTSSPTTTTVQSAYTKNNSKQQQTYRQEQKPITRRPTISYYSTSAPNVNSPTYEKNYYSIEPQSVSTLGPFKESQFANSPNTAVRTDSYFINNLGNQYNPPQFFPKPQESPKSIEAIKPETTTTFRTTVTSTTKPSSTYPSQLLETHNPYSINQAFHFSTPLDYHNFFDDYKEPYVPRGIKSQSISVTPTSSSTTKYVPPSTPPPPVQQNRQPPLNYLQNYSPEIHYENENQNIRYPSFNENVYSIKTETTPQPEIPYSNQLSYTNTNAQAITNTNISGETSSDTQSPSYDNYTEVTQSSPEVSTNANFNLSTKAPEYTQYAIDYNLQNTQTSTTSTTTSRTTRTRVRPRYPTTKSDSGENSTRATITRRPLRERKPLPTRPRYEPNKTSTEKPTRQPFESSESTTKSSRTRTRGRIHYRPQEADDIYTKRNKQSGKENDLAYQRDILHQNYPVTIMERTSTTDIEAITEPSERHIPTNNLEVSKNYDTADAYSSAQISITEPVNTESKDNPHEHFTSIETVPEPTHISKYSSINDENNDESQSSGSQATTFDVVKDNIHSEQNSPEYKIEHQHEVYYTRPASPVTDQNVPIYSINDELQVNNQEELPSQLGSGEESGTFSHNSQEYEQEENIVETTPSYNRVRVRPGVIRQYHQSSTESSKIKTEKRKLLQPITYRPAFEKRRTTMRIEEIEADLKTKQVHVRPEFQNYKQPVYKPESTTEAISTSSTTEASTKRSQFRRRRPAYSTTTETTVTRRAYEAKNRFRGRRPTEKPTEKNEFQTDVSSSTTNKNNLYNRYRDRPRLSERYNKKPETEEKSSEDQVTEDQDTNYSINRPKYSEPESERWSPTISRDSFKPYNPNNIADDIKTDSNGENVKDELDIITAKNNEYEDILVSVTPATNTRHEKKIPDIPPTLEALVEQSKVTKSNSKDNMSTFESMLEEVMKSLEEQDENEYTGKVMKHKGGEIGEIPPEKIITSGENYSVKSTTPVPEEVTTLQADNVSASISAEETSHSDRRRGFWKRVRKVRPASEEIEVAESQYYSNVVNRLGEEVQKGSFEKSGKGQSRVIVTTYKPNYQFLKDFFDSDDDEEVEVIPTFEIPKLSSIDNTSQTANETVPPIKSNTKADESVENINPGDMDLGTGSPNPTLDDSAFYTEPTESTNANIDRSDGLSLMDYLFGESSEDIVKNITAKPLETTTIGKVEIETEATKLKATTESSYIPDEFTAETENDNNDNITEQDVQSQVHREEIVTEKSVKFETSSVSSFMDPSEVISTSMSTEVSHETEICFRGRCIKTNKDIL